MDWDELDKEEQKVRYLEYQVGHLLWLLTKTGEKIVELAIERDDLEGRLRVIEKLYEGLKEQSQGSREKVDAAHNLTQKYLGYTRELHETLLVYAERGKCSCGEEECGLCADDERAERLLQRYSEDV